MPKKKMDKSKKILIIAFIVVILLAMGIAGLMFWQKQGKAPLSENIPQKIRIPVQSQAVLDYNRLEKDNELNTLMNKRKEEYGLNKEIDMVVTSKESIKIGDSMIQMQDILDKINLSRGDIVEKSIQSTEADSNENVQLFGIHVVQPGDNIWNIHFNFLKNYFNNKGISLSPLADEPDQQGLSSGVGKLLKFSENIVYIYNIREQKLDMDLNIIQPLSKIVVYNMNQVFALLNQIDYNQVNLIHFDGETLWIPAEQ
jgi:hypothetical protein